MEPRVHSPFAIRSRNFFRRHWQAALHWREKIVLQEEAFHLLLAALVGVIGGAVNLFFFYAGETMQRLFLPQPIDPVQAAELFAPWQRLAVPTLGGLAAGLILYWGFRLVGPQGSSDLLEVVVAGDGRLPFRTESVKTASAGISAAYNAPIAGAVFASLIVLGNFSMSLFAPLVCASVVATMVSRSFFGIEPWYHVPAFPPMAPAQLPWFVVLGLLCGGVSALFLKFLRAAKENFDRVKLPVYARLTLAGLAVGIIAAAGFPGVCGNGYFVTNAILHGELEAGANAFPQLGGLFFAKLLATAITVGAGTVGGVFTPTMFLGADAGALFGMTLHHFGGATGVPAGAFALVGMGATLAGTTKSPLLAMIMAFEISLDYSLMPPLMLGCVVAVLVSRQLHGESIYTEHMRLKGLSLRRENEQAGATMDKTVGDLMQAPVPPMRETVSLREIADRFLASSNNFVPIVDAQKRLVGVVALHDLKDFLHNNEELAGVIALDLMRPPPQCLTPGQRLLDALPLVLASELRNIPVVSTPSENRLVGSLSRAQMLAIFSEAIAEKSRPAG